MRESAKYKFNDGLYRVGAFSKKRVDITQIGDSIAVAPVIRAGKKGMNADITNVRYYTSTLNKKDGPKPSHKSFYNGDFDLDFLTILAKYRPASGELPPALHTTTYNGALYAGYRIDNYKLYYDNSPLKVYKRGIAHYGYSAGIFMGIGATPMSHNVTLPAIDYEYDGFTVSTGIAITAAVQNITVGIAFGVDNLTDGNHHAWIYTGRPWAGLGLGLNLN